MSIEIKPNGWNEWGKHVLLELERNESAHKEMMSELKTISESLVAIKIKAGLWGALAAAIPTLVGVLVILMKG